jgi:hypothetical protein
MIHCFNCDEEITEKLILESSLKEEYMKEKAEFEIKLKSKIKKQL